MQHKRTTSREDINKSQGSRSNNGLSRTMRKSFWLLQCFLPRSTLGGGGLWKLRNPATNSCCGDPNRPWYNWVHKRCEGHPQGMEYVGRSGKERTMETGMRGPRRDRHKGASHVKERGGREQIEVKSQSRKWKRKPEMKKKWSLAVRNHGLLISGVLIQRECYRKP